jgi:hypothetical protein
MTRRVYLHIGLLKTGTTFLQDALWDNKAALGERGVLVPGRHRRRHLLASLDIREDPKLARRAGDVPSPWQDLADEVTAWAGETAVISHEFSDAASEPQVRRVVESLGDAEVHVVLTVRALTDLGPSLWQEWVKNGGLVDIDSYPRSDDYDPTDEWGWGAFDLADILDRWGSVLPHERIHLLPMVSGARPEELWERFLAVLGVAPRGLPAPEQPSNRSLGLVEVELLRRVNARLEGFTSAGDRGHWIRGYLGHGHVMPETEERFRPGDDTVATLAARAERAVEMLRSGEYDVRGDLDSLIGGPPSPGLRHPGEVTDEELLDAAAQTIANMLQDVRSLTRERNRLLNDLERTEIEPPGRVSVSGFWSRLRKAKL